MGLGEFLSKYQLDIFVVVDKITLKFIWKAKELDQLKTIKKITGRINLSQFKTYHIVIVIKTVHYR